GPNFAAQSHAVDDVSGVIRERERTIGEALQAKRHYICQRRNNAVGRNHPHLLIHWIGDRHAAVDERNDGRRRDETCPTRRTAVACSVRSELTVTGEGSDGAVSLDDTYSPTTGIDDVDAALGTDGHGIRESELRARRRCVVAPVTEFTAAGEWADDAV